MADTARIERAIELLQQAQVRLVPNREAYILVDTAIASLLTEIGAQAAAELEVELVDLGRLIDELTDDDRRTGFA